MTAEEEKLSKIHEADAIIEEQRAVLTEEYSQKIAELSKSGQISTANDTSNGLWNYNPTPTTENNNEYVGASKLGISPQAK